MNAPKMGEITLATSLLYVQDCGCALDSHGPIQPLAHPVYQTHITLLSLAFVKDFFMLLSTKKECS